MEDKISMGDLEGNQFGLIIRLLNPHDAKRVGERIEKIREKGMINYFGMQRFGSCGTKTHMIGVKIIQRKWKEIVEDLLLEDTKDEYINQIKKEAYFESKNYGKAERMLPNKFKIEKSLLRGLAQYGLNYQNVFDCLPRSMKTLYSHSLQSYIWNRIVSRRLEEHGHQVIVGDLVGKEITGWKLMKSEIAEMDQIADKEQGRDPEKVEGNIPENEEEVDAEGDKEEERKYEVKLITDECDLKKYELTDLVMPLYGSSIHLPHESIAYKYVCEELEQLGLSEEDFQKGSKALCFQGQYRKIVIKPGKVEYQLIRHANQKDELQDPLYTVGMEVEELNKEESAKNKAAIHVVLQLPKSSYATIAIREMLHIPSSFQAQMILNRMYESEENEPKRTDSIPQSEQVGEDRRQ